MRPLSDDLRVSPELPLTDAMKKLGAAPGGRLLVLRGEELTGMLTKSGLGRFIEIRHMLDEQPRSG
jgi:hypothetical protein